MKDYKKLYNNLLVKYNNLKKQFLELEQQKSLIDLVNSGANVLYTDGGYDKDTKTGSWAFGTENQIINSGLITETDGTWNIQSEVTACINAILYADKHFNSVVIVHDLKGLPFWFNGNWKANFPCTKQLQALKHQIKVKVSFRLVKGHSGCKGNELVDSQCQELLNTKPFAIS